MKQTKYLKAFQAAPADTFQLVGDICLIEEIPDAAFEKTIKTDDGRTIALALSSGSQRQVNGIQADKPTFCRVLLPAPGWDDISAGDICLVPSTSIKRFSVFGKLMNYGEATLGLINAESIQLRFKGEVGFERFFDAVNRAAEEQVAERP